MKDYSTANQSRNHLTVKIVILSCLVLLLLLLAAGSYVYFKVARPVTDFSQEKVFEIKAGESVGQIAQRLEEENLISSAFIFRLYAIVRKLSDKVQAGSFRLDSNLSVAEVLQRLTQGTGLADERRVTFREGMSLKDYAAVLETAELFKAETFLRAASSDKGASEYDFLKDKPKSRSLEGYLFPDTYNFKETAKPEEVIAKMLENFGRKLSSELRAEIVRQKKSIFEIVTMASLIEGEVGRNLKPGSKLTEADAETVQRERRLVAGVFYNRLDANHALESDATLTYITGIKKAQASFEDTRIDHPYNTYRNRGLPPGPINNPSLDSILAAINPAQNDYFYFLAKPTGEIVFSKTLDEHNENKAKYLK